MKLGGEVRQGGEGWVKNIIQGRWPLKKYKIIFLRVLSSTVRFQRPNTKDCDHLLFFFLRYTRPTHRKIDLYKKKNKTASTCQKLNRRRMSLDTIGHLRFSLALQKKLRKRASRFFLCSSVSRKPEPGKKKKELRHWCTTFSFLSLPARMLARKSSVG